MKRVFKNKLNENKNYLRKNQESGQLAVFPLNNVLAQDNLENSAPSRLLLLITGLLIFYFIAHLDEVIYSHNIILQQKDFCISGH